MVDELTFALTFAEYREASRLLFARAFPIRYFLGRYWYVVAAVFAVVAAGLWHVEQSIAWIAVCVSCGLAGAGIITMMLRPVTLRRIYRKSPRLSREQTIRFSADGITGRQPTGNSGFVPWGQVNAVLKGKSVWVLRAGFMEAIMIPTRVLNIDAMQRIEAYTDPSITPPALP